MAITDATLRECEESARFWTARLPSYGQKMQDRANSFAIATAVLSAVTALAVWGTLAESTDVIAALAVSAVSVTTALLTAIPKIKGWAECAGAVPGLVSRYAHAIGELQDARAALAAAEPGADKLAQKARAEFEAVKADKQRLKPFPSDLQSMPRC